MALFLSGNYSASADSVTSLDYSVVQFTDTTGTEDQIYYMLKNKGTNYWGTYVLNPLYCRSLVVQSPHPIKDFNTGKQGVYVFRETKALFFAMSGTSRCNQTAFSSCDGTTTVCSGSDDKFRLSDMAHNDSTVFQSTTDTLARRFPQSVFVQLHGFDKGSSDPYVIMSNGTRNTPTPDYVTQIRDELYAIDTVLTFKRAHIDVSWNKLVALTNTQGRRINGSSDPCSTSPSATSGRFIHIEQEKTRLRNNSSGWAKMVSALSTVFVCETLLPIELKSFKVRETTTNKVEAIWSIVLEHDNGYCVLERSPDAHTWQPVANVPVSGGRQEYIATDDNPIANTSYYRLRLVDGVGGESFSPIRAIWLVAQALRPLVFPNPTWGVINVLLQKNTGHVQLTNVMGITQEIDPFPTENGFTIDIGPLQPGMYLLHIGEYVFRILKLGH